MENNVQLWSALEDKCLTETDDGTVLTNAVAGQTSTRELLEKANRTQTKRVIKAKQGMFQGGVPPYGFDVVCLDHKGLEQWRYVMTGRKRGIQVFSDGSRKEVGASPGMIKTARTTTFARASSASGSRPSTGSSTSTTRLQSRPSPLPRCSTKKGSMPSSPTAGSMTRSGDCFRTRR